MRGTYRHPFGCWRSFSPTGKIAPGEHLSAPKKWRVAPHEGGTVFTIRSMWGVAGGLLVALAVSGCSASAADGDGAREEVVTEVDAARGEVKAMPLGDFLDEEGYDYERATDSGDVVVAIPRGIKESDAVRLVEGISRATTAETALVRFEDNLMPVEVDSTSCFGTVFLGAGSATADPSLFGLVISEASAATCFGAYDGSGLSATPYLKMSFPDDDFSTVADVAEKSALASGEAGMMLSSVVKNEAGEVEIDLSSESYQLDFKERLDFARSLFEAGEIDRADVRGTTMNLHWLDGTENHDAKLAATPGYDRSWYVQELRD